MAKYVNSKVVINPAVIRGINRVVEGALVATATDIRTEIENAQVVPRDTGTLEESMFIDDSSSGLGTVDIVTNTPYARRLYYHPEYNFHREAWVDDKGITHNDCNSNAGAGWYKSWADGGKIEGEVLEYFVKHMERLMR